MFKDLALPYAGSLAPCGLGTVTSWQELTTTQGHQDPSRCCLQTPWSRASPTALSPGWLGTGCWL